MLSGSHDRGFEPLARALEQVISHAPFGGAGLCVYHAGRPVFDMWGGPRDSAGAPWEEHTPSVSFSTTKGVASTALHMLVDRGQVGYDETVARYWPEFGQRGKDKITVRQVLTHSAGLYDARSLIAHADDLLDWDKTCAALAEAPAAHAPGRYHAYHALTYGHLVGEIVRRVSGKPFSQFVHDEIAAPLGLHDFFVGAPDEAIARAARLIFPKREARTTPRPAGGGPRPPSARQRRLANLQRVLRLFGVPMSLERFQGAFSPRGIGRWDFSAPRVLHACIPSVNGLFSARDLARFYQALALGGSLDGVRLLSERTLAEATKVYRRGPDGVLVLPMGWRLGYHAVPTRFGVLKGAFGHAGYGGSGAWASPLDQVSVGFTVNAGSGTPVGDLRLVKLSSVALACVRASRGARVRGRSAS
jgi:CubicO group peptidase (beta-lactamase class C family)